MIMLPYIKPMRNKYACCLLTILAVIVVFGIRTGNLLSEYPQVKVPLATIYGEEDRNLTNLSRDGQRLRSDSDDTRIQFAFDNTVPIRSICFEISNSTRTNCRSYIYLDDSWQQESVLLQNGRNYIDFESAGNSYRTSQITMTPVSIRGVSFDLVSFTVNPWEHLILEEVQNALLLLMVLLLTEGILLELLAERRLFQRPQTARLAGMALLQAILGGLFLEQYLNAEWTWQQMIYYSGALLAEGLLFLMAHRPVKEKLELPVLRILLLSVYCFGITELLYADRFLLDQPWSVVWNLLVYAAVYFLLYAVSGICGIVPLRKCRAGKAAGDSNARRSGRRSGYLPGTAWWLIVALINHYYFEFRAQAFELSDLSMAGTAKNVIAQYRLEITPEVLFVYMSFAMILLGLLTERKDTLPARRTSGRVLALAACAVSVLLVCSNLPAVNLWNTNIGTKHHGYALSYISFAKRHLEKPVPQGYSAEETEELLRGYETEEARDAQEVSADSEAVDVIVVMNEAFSDLPTTYGFETNRDGLPFIHSLEGSNVKKGWMLSSVFGGTTADTEYEFLTGNAVAFLNAEAVPYTQYINSQQESLAWLLKNRGYSATAFHPYLESGYKRYKVYPYLGFDDFISTEDGLTYTERIRTYISDASDYKQLEKLYEEKAEDGPVFLFNVTMQNHGSYNTDVPAVDVTVQPKDENLQYAQLEEYLSLAYESDRAFAALTEYFSQTDRKVILLMFGDHQPSLKEEVLKALEPEMYEEGASVEEREKKYTVPYILWANFDLPKEPEAAEIISPGYLRSFLLENAGIRGSAYDRFVSEVRKSYPAINILGYYDADGNAHDISGAWDETLLDQYRKAAYYNLFDHRRVNLDLFIKG